jgi:hypothetical protein
MREIKMDACCQLDADVGDKMPLAKSITGTERLVLNGGNQIISTMQNKQTPKYQSSATAS